MYDHEFTADIKKILEDKMAASALDINVETKDGYIHLSGMVDTLGEKLAAEKIVEHIDGVKRVENNITIATDGYIPDSDVENYIKRRMMESPGLVNVTPKVQGGAATLYGHVGTYSEKERALELAEQCMGVKSVASSIKIETEGQFDDAQITSKIAQVLDSNRIDFEDVDSNVKNGAVTLEGFVKSKYEVELAEELVGRLDGVRKVRNRLRTRE